MSKRCELQKEYHREFGNYKGVGKYSDHYVNWLESKILALNIDDVSNNVVSLFCPCIVPSLNYGLTADYKCNKCNRPLK